MTNGESLEHAEQILYEAEQERHRLIKEKIENDCKTATDLKNALSLPVGSISRQLAESIIENELGDEQKAMDTEKRERELIALEAMKKAQQAQIERWKIEEEKRNQAKEGLKK